MARPEEPPVIRAADPASLAEALNLVFSRFEPDQAAEYLRIFGPAICDGTVSREGLLEARRGRHLVGAALYQVQPGRTAMVWPPRLACGAPSGTGDLLLAEISRRLAGAGVRLASALLNKADVADHAALSAAGFTHLADLLYLVSTEEEFPFAPPHDPLEFEPYRQETYARLARVVQGTYAESLDCPDLDGIREIDDVLAGYRATGEFSPDRWMVVRHEGGDVGCLLLADHPHEATWELVYMGLIASARGRGWGKAMVRQAQWLTRQAGRARLVVAVDAANRPAVGLYEATGFRGWDQRRVYAKVFPESRISGSAAGPPIAGREL